MQKIIPTQKLAVFDLDDCLAPTINIFGHYLAEDFMKTYNIPYPEADELRLYGMEEAGCSVQYVIDRDGFNGAHVEEVYTRIGQKVVENIHHYVEPCNHMQNNFANLQAQGWTIALLTQGRKDYAYGVLQHLAIEQFFYHPDLIMGRDCVNGTSKRTTEPSSPC